ncbi:MULTISPECIES: hypothetical protein [unclassified Burkholderia]|uniref:hypothetical protein n=1 Tax=unclassified Burkholderia TaxID=2613784 RepID=UPI000ABBB493|nr:MULTISPECIES: hypothetical protein [unclassified Burkholderia]
MAEALQSDSASAAATVWETARAPRLHHQNGICRRRRRGPRNESPTQALASSKGTVDVVAPVCTALRRRNKPFVMTTSLRVFLTLPLQRLIQVITRARFTPEAKASIAEHPGVRTCADTH